MGESFDPHDGVEESEQTVEVTRAIHQADVLMDRATFYDSEKMVRGMDEISMKQMDVMYGNARAAYLLLKFAHPDKTTTDSELQTVGNLIEDWELYGWGSNDE